MLHTFTYALAATLLAVAIGLLVAFIVARRIIPFGSTLAVVCLAPFVIPGMVLAIGFYAAYAPPPLALYGTSLIVILALATRFLPIAFAGASSGMRTINPDMENQMRNLGGDRLMTVRYVVLPLLKQSLIGAGILVFIPALRELSTAVFLTTDDTRTLSVMIFDLSEQGRLETLAAIGLILLAATIVVVGVGFKLLGRNFLMRREI
jgi:iron(III) transport system permease protein